MMPNGPECQHQRAESREDRDDARDRIHTAAVIVRVVLKHGESEPADRTFGWRLDSWAAGDFLV
jgi:hypothetical protein